ncbi:MAG TPA: hypothetical protein V6D11_10260 [Waterburya sp.]|jgi:REP element-mobilizing transposase RayT
MEESAVYLKYSGQGFAHDAIALWALTQLIAVLPDHLRCIWTLPEGDANFSTGWRLIKSEFSRSCPEQYKQYRSASSLSKGEQAIWYYLPFLLQKLNSFYSLDGILKQGLL